MSQSFMITSGKGGVGKSTLTAAIAVGFALRGQSVVVVDADMGLRNLDMMLGLHNRVVYDLGDVAKGTCKLKQTLIYHAKYPTLALLPAAQSSGTSALTPSDMRRLVAKLEKHFSYVLVDCPAGAERGFTNVLGCTHEVVLVTTPDDVAMRDAEKIAGLINKAGKDIPMSLIINRMIPAYVKTGEMYAPKVIAETLDLPLLGAVPQEEQVYRLLLKHQTLMEEKNDAQAAVNRIVRRMMGESVPMINWERNPSFMQRLFHRGKGE